MLGRSILRASNRAIARQSLGKSTVRLPPIDLYGRGQSFSPTCIGFWKGSVVNIHQRASSTAAGAEAASSPFYLTVTAALATAAAAGSTAWYFHLYGQEAFAMTPAEEG